MLPFFLLVSLVSSFFTAISADTECPVVTSPPGDRRDDTNKLRIVQYNTEWLFIDYYSSANCPGNGCPWKTLSDAEVHLSYVSNIIRELNPDIINLCEVEGCDELNMLVDDLDGNYKSYLKKGSDSSTGQNVGMLTRIDPLVNLYRTENRYNYPIAGSKCGYTGSPGSSGVSKHYITEFNISNIKVAFISAHLLAYPTDPERCAEREAQAMILQSIIAGYVSRNYEVIMLGDFNDFDYEILDINSNKPISYVLDILKGLYGDYKDKYLLHSVAESIEQQYRFSDWYDSDNNCNTDSIKDYSVLDHILVTEKLQNKIVNAFFYHGYDEYCGTYNSDHYPVIIDLLL